MDLDEYLEKSFKHWNDFYLENRDLIKNILHKIEDDDYHPSDVFRMFRKIKPNDIKVVILGQDPYPDKSLATGMSFDIPKHKEMSKSLKNICKELKRDLNIDKNDGCLKTWVDQGVLLLNVALTFTEKSGHLKKKIWNDFFVEVIKYIHSKNKDIIYMLWGTEAKNNLKMCKIKNLKTIESYHPASYGKYSFIGSGCFSKVNDMLKDLNQECIDWS